jgi:hypothetical protein
MGPSLSQRERGFINPLSLREREGPAPEAWEGEGRAITAQRMREPGSSRGVWGLVHIP